MRASLLTALLLILLVLPGSGRAQERQGAAEAPAREDAWNLYPEPVKAPSPTPEDANTNTDAAPFEPNSFPGASAASEVNLGDSSVAESPPPPYEPFPPVMDAASTEHQEEEPTPSAPIGNPGTVTTSTPRHEEGDAAPFESIGHSEAAFPSRPTHSSAPELPATPLGSSANEDSSRLGLLPLPEPRLSPRLAPEPLAVPLLRSLLDMAGASVVTLVSAVGVEALVGTRCLRETDRMCILTSFLVTFLSVSGTAPVGAWAVGSLLGGEGKLWAAYIGSAMGMGLAVVGTMPTIAFGSGVILAVAGPIGAVVGAAIGYEVSHRLSLRRSTLSAERSPALRMTPVLGATPRGSLVGGMMGSF